MKKYERVKALVSLDAIAHNFEEMHKNVKEGTKIIAVIKADGYGHGARAIARLIQDYDYIWGFATATAEEALELRHAGITKPVMILGLVFEEYYEELAAMISGSPYRILIQRQNMQKQVHALEKMYIFIWLWIRE